MIKSVHDPMCGFGPTGLAGRVHYSTDACIYCTAVICGCRLVRWWWWWWAKARLPGPCTTASGKVHGLVCTVLVVMHQSAIRMELLRLYLDMGMGL